MTNRLKNVVLICSLVFNITFISYIVYHHVKETPLTDYHRIQRNHNKPHLHRDAKEFQKPQSILIREIRADFIDQKREFFIRLSSPNIDKEELTDILEKVVQKQVKMEKTIGMAFIEKRMEMSDNEAENFYNRFLNRTNKHYQKPRR